MQTLKKIKDEAQLEELLSIPETQLVEFMKRLQGDIMILGIGGKMGITLGRLAVNAVREAEVKKEVYGVSRFGSPEGRAKLEEWGIKTIACDLLDQNSVNELPQIPNIIYMAGKKFGTDGQEEMTWAMNTVVPAYVAEHFKQSRIVVFSTGCVYPLYDVTQIGCTEEVAPAPIGEYSQSCLGRERVFGHFAKQNNTPTLLFRLCYAIDLRYGVLHDIAQQIYHDEPVNNSVGYFNCIWQGSANTQTLLCLEHCGVPAVPMNVTGPETVATEYVAERIGRIMGKKVKYLCEKSGTRGYLNNAWKAQTLFGNPSVGINTLIDWQAHWIIDGNPTLGKPTHFEVNNGKF